VLVGHKGQTITSRYVHAADAALVAAADGVAIAVPAFITLAIESDVHRATITRRLTK
jgi:hypothetical protein